MFHWICPECGREIPPAMTECPACEPQPAQASMPAASPVAAVPQVVAAAAPPVPRIPVPAAASVLSSVADRKPSAEVPAESPLDPLLVLAERIRAAQTAAAEQHRAPQLRELAAAVGGAEAPTLDLIPVPVLAGPPSAPQGSAERAQPVALLAAPQAEAPSAPVALADPIPAPLPPMIPQIREEPTAPVALANPVSSPLPPIVPKEIREEPLAALVQPVPVALAIPAPPPLPPMVPQEVREEPVAPVVPAAPVALATQAPPALPPAVPQEVREKPIVPVALAVPAPPTLPPVPQEVRDEPVAASVQAAPVALAEPPTVPAEEPAAQSAQPAPPPAPLADTVSLLLPLPAAPQPPPESRVEALMQTSARPLQEAVAEKLPSGPWLKLAPLQNYSAAAARSMRPAAPPVKILTPDSGPRITLPGPVLPQQLNVRENLQVVTVLGERPRKHRSVPGWVISFLVMAGLLAVGVAIVFYLLPASHTTADAKSAAPEPVTATPAVEASHPLAQTIEVTGFRFVMDLNKKSEIHYLVVNHSAAELSDMTVFVTVRTAGGKAGQPPLCRFSFRSTGLAPFESKEMTSSIEKLPRPVALPDWHDLRAEVQIAQ
jgi:hypothetical protein